MKLILLRHRGLTIPYGSLILAERCFDAYAKIGMNISLNVKTYTITIF